jgi:hypothetical protein
VRALDKVLVIQQRSGQARLGHRAAHSAGTRVDHSDRMTATGPARPDHGPPCEVSQAAPSIEAANGGQRTRQGGGFCNSGRHGPRLASGLRTVSARIAAMRSTPRSESDRNVVAMLWAARRIIVRIWSESPIRHATQSPPWHATRRTARLVADWRLSAQRSGVAPRGWPRAGLAPHCPIRQHRSRHRVRIVQARQAAQAPPSPRGYRTWQFGRRTCKRSHRPDAARTPRSADRLQGFHRPERS